MPDPSSELLSFLEALAELLAQQFLREEGREQGRIACVGQVNTGSCTGKPKRSHTYKGENND